MSDVLEFSLGNIALLESDRRNCGVWTCVQKVDAKALWAQDVIPTITNFPKFIIHEVESVSLFPWSLIF